MTHISQIATQTLLPPPSPPIIPKVDYGFDKWKCTFRHEIKCHPTDSYPAGRVLVGYSKRNEFSEKLDKQEVLKGYIERIWFDHSYRQKAEWMKIYWKNGPVNREHPLLLTLYPTRHDPTELTLDLTTLNAWLRAKFQPGTAISAGPKNIQELFDPKKIAELEMQQRHRELKETQLFNPQLADNPLAELPIFPDRQALVWYCDTLIKTGHRPRGAVEQYWRNMKAKYAQYADGQ